MSDLEIRDLLERHGIRPSKGLGQNLLVAEWAYERIVAASDLAEADHVLEIGPGLGTLTRYLADRAGQVTAVELDARRVAVLKETLQGRSNVRVVQGDILELDPQALISTGAGRQEHYKVVANLPYYITSRVLRHLLSACIRPGLLTLMVQKEVAERIVAPAGSMSLLAVSVQAYGDPEVICSVPASAFYPRPKVASAVMTIRTYAEPLVPEEMIGPFFRVVRAGFQQKRKQLHNSLGANLGLPPDRIDSALLAARIARETRPQALGVDDWLGLTRALYQED